MTTEETTYRLNSPRNIVASAHERLRVYMTKNGACPACGVRVDRMEDDHADDCQLETVEFGLAVALRIMDGTL